MAKNTATKPEPTSTLDLPPLNPEDVAPTRLNALSLSPWDLHVVGVDPEPDGTTAGPENPLYDERIKLPLDPFLVANIRQMGVLRPVLYRKDGERYLVIDGRRRVMHARAAWTQQRNAGETLVKVPAMAKRGTNVELFGISRASNAMAVVDDPMQNARNAQRHLDMGATEATTAVVFGVSVQTIKDWQKLLDVAPEIQEQVTAKKVTATAAMELSKLSMADQVKVMRDATEAAGGAIPKADAVINAVREAQGKNKTVTPKEKLASAHDKLCTFAKAQLAGSKLRDMDDDIGKLVKGLCVTLTGKKWDSFLKSLAAEQDDASK